MNLLKQMVEIPARLAEPVLGAPGIARQVWIKATFPCRAMLGAPILQALLAACLLLAPGGQLRAQANLPAKNTPQQQLEIDSDSGYFDGLTNQMVYLGHVFVTDHVKAKMTCERLTVNIPQDGGHPTNIVADTGVVLDLVDGKGQTNHITANQAIYAYSVKSGVTNETVTFTGGDPLPRVENPQIIQTGEPLVFNVVLKRFSANNFRTILKKSPGAENGTNASPFNFLK